MFHLLRSEKGYALLITSSLLAIVSLLGFAMMSRMDGANTLQKGAATRDQAFYMVEGVRSIAQSITQNYFSGVATSTPTIAGLKAALDSQLPSYVPQGYSVAPVEIAGDLSPLNITTGAANPIPNGPFAGVYALQAKMVLSLKIYRDVSFTSTLNSSNKPVGVVTLETQLSKFSPFQFLQFWDHPFRDIIGPGVAPGQLSVNGRIHSNGDVCIAQSGNSGQNTAFTSLTVAGALMSMVDSRCRNRYPGNPGNWTFNILISDLNGNAINPLPDATVTSGCADCNGSGQSWPLFAFSRFQGMVHDYFQGVPQLKIPEATSALTQPGLDGDPDKPADNARSNNGNLRFLIDPVLATDNQAVKDKKFAALSDVRIINGVWYLKGTWTGAVSPPTYLATLNAWPGIPIWSDHPGRADDEWGKKVGQDDIRELWATTPWAWGALPPRQFSPYAYNTSNQRLTTSLTGAITYGLTVASHPSENQANNVNDPNIRTNAVEQGFYGNILCTGVSSICQRMDYSNATHPWCPMPTGTSYKSSYMQVFSGSAIPPNYPLPNFSWVKAASPMTCGYCRTDLYSFNPYGDCDVGTVPLEYNILLSAREGFRDYNIVNQSANDGNQNLRGNIVPTNFSVNNFALALGSGEAGELGNYFGSGKFRPDPFNGIVYITNTWPGSNLGFGAATPPPEILNWPFQGAATDSDQPSAAGPFEQQALPFSLCSNPTSASRPGVAGLTFVPRYAPNGTPVPTFRVPDCTKYGRLPGQIGAYSNGIVITNAYDLTAFRRTGLSIVSNIPVYVNSGINTRGVWSPTLVAGDTVTLRADCNVDKSFEGLNKACPGPGYRFWNTAILGGWSGVRNTAYSFLAPGMSNTWSGNSTILLKGAITMGFHPVYYRSNRERMGSPPNAMTLDPNFNDPKKVPPGMPFFTVYSLSQWKRK